VTKGRLEAFSDGVLAIIITIMVLELKVPHEPSFEALAPLWPVFLSYLLSFVYLGIYWNNHHHLLHTVQHVDGRVLWSNLHLLFWLSLVPFVTAWLGETGFEAVPTFAYGVVLLLAAVAYYVLVRALIARHGRESTLARAVGRDFKGTISVAIYAVGVVASLFDPRVSLALYVVVAILWLVPDRRMERSLTP
jgi:uncharacterized membrane protein